MKHIRIGSRGSDLALWQANHVKNQLEQLGHSVEITIIKTQGDAIQHLSFDKMEGKGFFTKEIEQALLEDKVDLAVHSHKDLETDNPAGLIIAAVSERENPSDLILVRKESLSEGIEWKIKTRGVIGTSSARRKAMVRTTRPDLAIHDLRGNVPTRIQKLREGLYDAIILAKAGVDRLQIDLREFELVELDPTVFVPAPAQGVLGLQIREKDKHLFDILQELNHKDIEERIRVERTVLNLMDGGCQLPLGVYCAADHQVYVQHTTDWQEGSKHYHYKDIALEEMPQLIVKELKSLQLS